MRGALTDRPDGLDAPEIWRGPAVRRAPGMIDVARLAGVSHQTVSRVLNGHPSVRPETRARIIDAIEVLGYRRNSAARALVTRRTNTVGVLTTGGPICGATSTLLAVEEAARGAGLSVSIAVVQHPTPDAVVGALEHLIAQGVEGVVVVAPQRDAIAAARAASTSVPVVVVAAGEVPGPGLCAVSVDQELGAVLATRHLLELGHRDVVHVAGPTDWVDARLRVAGWRAERARWGLAPAEAIPGDWSAARGYAVGRSLVARASAGDGAGALPTAVLAANDHQALGILRAFAEAGVPVPDRVSVVGFDDVEGAAYFSPPLTTVRQDFEGLGRRCMAALLAALGRGLAVPGPGGAAQPTVAPGPTGPLAPTLVLRASTAWPSA